MGPWNNLRTQHLSLAPVPFPNKDACNKKRGSIYHNITPNTPTTPAEHTLYFEQMMTMFIDLLLTYFIR